MIPRENQTFNYNVNIIIDFRVFCIMLRLHLISILMFVYFDFSQIHFPVLIWNEHTE